MAFNGKQTNPAVVICKICRNPVEWNGNPTAGWFHPHSGDPECWTGDGSVAYPERIN